MGHRTYVEDGGVVLAEEAESRTVDQQKLQLPVLVLAMHPQILQRKQSQKIRLRHENSIQTSDPELYLTSQGRLNDSNGLS